MEKLTSILAVAPALEKDGEVLLAKALKVARAFDARLTLIVTHPEQAKHYLSSCGHAAQVCVVGDGRHAPEDLVLRMTLDTRPDLVIKRAAGPHSLRRFTIGANDWRLAYDSPVPLLLTRDKPWSSPPRFAAAVDMAEGGALASAILHTGGFLALGCEAPIDILYSEREARDETLRMSRAVRLAQIVREFHVGCERLRLLSGAPEHTLPPFIARQGYDVLALGSYMTAGGFTALTGGLSARLAEASEADILFVSAAERTHSAGRPHSFRNRAAL